jgi:hypothetical protein
LKVLNTEAPSFDVKAIEPLLLTALGPVYDEVAKQHGATIGDDARTTGTAFGTDRADRFTVQFTVERQASAPATDTRRSFNGVAVATGTCVVVDGKVYDVQLDHFDFLDASGKRWFGIIYLRTADTLKVSDSI